MRRRSLAAMLAITVSTMLATSLGIDSAEAQPAGAPHGLHLAAHRVAPVNHRTGLPVGDVPTRGQLTRAAHRNASSSTTAPKQNTVVNYHLTYNGGPVVSNVEVQPVRWGAGTYIPEVAETTTPNLSTFFQSITQTPYFGWLSEYNTTVTGGTGQKIGVGSVLPTLDVTPAAPANGTTITDAEIQQELFNQIVNSNLPTPSVDSHNLENTVYALTFPSGVNICQDSGLTECSGMPPGVLTGGQPSFCGYHSSFAVVDSNNHKVGDVRYIVLPDSGSSLWQSGCTTPESSTAATGLEAVASHELAEVVTDPEVGEATSFSSPLGWYDGNGASNDPGEIADICDEAQPDHASAITGTDGQAYALEHIWSNRAGRCDITQPPTAATNLVATPVAGGAVSLHWTASAIGGGLPVHYDIYETPTGGTPAQVDSTSATTWTSPALTSGTSYDFQVVASNTTGSATAAGPVSATSDATAPAVHVTSAPATFTLTGSAKISYGATDTDSPSGITYDVAYKAASWNGSWGALTTLTHGTTATSASLTVRPGVEYCLVVRAHDHAGNVSGWSSPRCTAAPLDDASLGATTSGWTRAHVTAAYRGTITRTAKSGAKLAVSGAYANRLGLLVATCPTCGNVQIWVGSTLWKTVSTKSSAWHYKHLVLPGTFSSRHTGVTIRVASGVAEIDGLGIFRSAPTF